MAFIFAEKLVLVLEIYYNVINKIKYHQIMADKISKWDKKIPKILAHYFVFAYNISAGSNTLYTCETELTFKRYAISSDTRPPIGGFFFLGV